MIMNVKAQTITLSGKVTDENNNPLENAAVTLIKAKDSSIVNFLGTGKNGKFSLKVPVQKEATMLQISGEQLSGFSKNFSSIDNDVDLGIIALKKELVSDIEEVKITVSPVKIKKDTVEYNASYLKVAPDDKIDELLNQIPGVEADDDGNITINGKPVNKILINGKPFFNKDGKIALETFSADIIKKIQITTSKSKEEEFTGRAPLSDSLTVNFNMDEKNNRGSLNNIGLGYGTDDRYEGTLFMTRFKGDRNIALIAAANNINTTGFSVDSFFAKNNRRSSTNGKPVNSGIMKSSMIGLNFTDKIGDNFNLDKFSTQYNDNDLETYSKTSRTTFLPDYKLEQNSEKHGNSDSRKFTANTDASIKLDPLTNIILSMDFTNNSSENDSKNETSTLRDDVLLNSSSGSSHGNSVSNTFSPKITLARKFKNPNRSLSASINNTFLENKNKNINLLDAIFYQSPEDNEYRNQRSQTINSKNIFGANVKYYEPVSDSATVSLELNYDLQKIDNERLVNDFDENNHQYSNYNSLLSNVLNQNNSILNTGIGYNLNKSKYMFRASANLNVSNLGITSLYNSQNYNLNRNFVLPDYQLMTQYRFSNAKSLRLTNQGSYDLPSADLLNPYVDESDPLKIDQGNPDLKSTWINTTSLNYNAANVPKSTNFYVNLNFSYENNSIANYSFYDDSGVQYSTFANISGNKRANARTSFSKTYKWNGNRLTINPSFSASYNFRKGFVDGAMYTNNMYSLQPRFTLRVNWKDKMDLRSTLGINYSISNYTNYRVDKTQTSRQNLTLGTTNYFINKNLFFTNDFVFSRNTNVGSDFNKSSYFWNTSLGYQFYKKQMILKLKVYDLLNQRQNIERTIGDNFVEDSEELVLRRYFMLSLILKFNKAGK